MESKKKLFDDINYFKLLHALIGKVMQQKGMDAGIEILKAVSVPEDFNAAIGILHDYITKNLSLFDWEIRDMLFRQAFQNKN